ncbi:hypothetical protein B0T12DRAFT_509448 [Alternaria alternata]|nr:hypothetical protein B0T12DRAFT_509448 [Alternaria alternata]
MCCFNRCPTPPPRPICFVPAGRYTHVPVNAHPTGKSTRRVPRSERYTSGSGLEEHRGRHVIPPIPSHRGHATGQSGSGNGAPRRRNHGGSRNHRK